MHKVLFEKSYFLRTYNIRFFENVNETKHPSYLAIQPETRGAFFALQEAS